MWWRGPLPRLRRPHPFVDFFLRSDLANRHILGCGDPGVGPIAQNSKSGDIVYNARNRQVSSSYV